MIRKLCAAGATISLCLTSVTPALAQDYRFAGQDGPRGANATFNFRVPLGRSARPSRPTVGLTFGIGRTMGAGSVDGQEVVRQMRFGDFRFTGDGLRQARIAGFDLARPEGDRLFASGPKPRTMPLLLTMVLVGAGACVIAGCLSGDDDEEEENEDPVSPGL